MNYLLKIIEGPMKGAEVALVPGTTVKFGSSDACDIVIGDATMPAVAGELEVTDEDVTLIASDGKSDRLNPFELRDFGTTAFAIGPADGKWQEVMRRRKVEKAGGGGESDTTGDPGRAGAPRPPEADPAGASSEAAPEDRPPRRSGLGCLLVLVVIILLGIAAWFFWPKIVETCPQADSVRVRLADTTKSFTNWLEGRFDEKAPAPVVQPAVPEMTLAQLAEQHTLKLGVTPDKRPLLTGNLARRTERLAIRALALAIDPSVAFDLTDDETMKNAANELLFAATDGLLSVSAAKNRALVLTGYSPSAAALEKALKQLNADVPGITSVDAKNVRVGGVPPQKADRTDVAANAEATSSAVPKAAAKKPAVRRDYPIAGILTVPYPCVVMRNGMRLVEGAVVGTATLVKIEADKLTLKEGNATFEWKP